MESIDRSALISLHHYGIFANTLVLETAAKMSEEELSRNSSPSNGSVMGLLHHMLRVEVRFLAECENIPIESIYLINTTPTLQEIVTSFNTLEKEQGQYLDRVTDEELSQKISVTIRAKSFLLPRWQFLSQSLLQSIHHRGELSIVMTQLGYPLPTLDPIIQYATESGQAWF
jgi:uncharacterized damage-inducible protein DinB